jgi:hypothetical protein
MRADRTTVHIARPAPDEYVLLRLLSPAERLQAMLTAARAKAATLGTIDAGSDTGKGVPTGNDEADLAHQEGE